MKCETCKFFNPKGYDGMICMRYPQSVTVGRNHWCGEYVAATPDAERDRESLERDAHYWRRFARDNPYIATWITDYKWHARYTEDKQ